MARPRSRLSFSGIHRRSSSGSVPKINLNETAQDKARYKINTKADPTMAISEVQPAQLQTLGETTIKSLRNLEHRDAEGNVITDPDRSNPTRPRLERPLDTIRSFEAAIDGSYNRRQSFRADSNNPQNAPNRRSSYFNGYQPQQRNHNGNNHESGSTYGGYYANTNRNSMSHTTRPNSYIDPYGVSPANQQSSSRRFGPRNHSDPSLYGRNAEQGIYQSYGQQQSYDTVGTTSNGSHVTDQWGNSTDPSSENSSIDKYQAPPPAPPKQPDLGEIYGFNGFGGAPQFQGPILEEYSSEPSSQRHVGYGQSREGYHDGYGFQRNEAPPAVPPHRAPVPPPKTRGSSTLSKPRTPSNRIPSSRAPPVTDNSEKRKSWIKRRFSRF